jgi:exoribonuclease-2
VEKGTLIEFRLHGERRLAVADRPEGKKHWIVIDEQGNAHTVHPRQITYTVDSGSYQSSDISEFAQDLQPYLDSSSLAVAWEILVEDGETVNPQEMAQLLFSENTPQHCYASHLLLVNDKLYFKQKGDRYEPRSPNQVAEIQHQQKVEQQRQQETQAFWDRMQRGLGGESVEWQGSDRNRLDAIERFCTLWGRGIKY